MVSFYWEGWQHWPMWEQWALSLQRQLWKSLLRVFLDTSSFATPVCGLRWDRRSEMFLRSCRLHFQDHGEIGTGEAEGGWWALSASQDCMPIFSWPLWGWGREPGTHLLGVVCWPGEYFAQPRSPQWRATVVHNERDRVHCVPPLNFMLSLQTACAFI